MMSRIKDYNHGKRDAMNLDYGEDDEDPQIFSLDLGDHPNMASKGSCKDMNVCPEMAKHSSRLTLVTRTTKGNSWRAWQNSSCLY